MPATFETRGAVIVRVTIAGRGLDMLVDTGTDRNVLDASVFNALGLGVGQSVATVDAASFGSAVVHGFVVHEGSYYRREQSGELVVGLLGYDFFKSAVVEIDYDRQQLTVVDPASFVVPAHGMEYSLYPEERVPLVSASVGSASGGSFIIDTGATTVVVFPRLVINNPTAFTASQELSSDRETEYFHFFWPMCGHTDMVPYAVESVSVGTVGVKNWVVWAVPSDSCFATRRLDGLIGFDFLRLFDVYVDYPENRIILVPNAVYDKAPNTLKP